ncbi:50S ribosomal protein L12P family protein, partial [Oesophagostomum dentatum]
MRYCSAFHLRRTLNPSLSNESTTGKECGLGIDLDGFAEVQEQKAEKAEDVAAQQDQAQIPGNVAGNTEVKKIESLENKDNQQIPGPDSLVDKTNLDAKKVEEEKKDARK